MKPHRPDNSINLLTDADRTVARRKGIGRLLVGGFLREMVTFALSVVVLLLLLNGANTVASGLKAKSKVLGAATQGIAHLQEAEALVKQKNFSTTAQELWLARDSFASAKQTMSGLGGFVNSVLALSPQGKSAQALLDAGEAASEAAINLNNMYLSLAGVTLSPQGIQSDGGLYQALGRAKGFFANTNSYLARADKDLAEVDPSALPQSVRIKFSEYKDILDNSPGALQQSYDLIDLFQQFLGPGQKTVLVLFENDAELRAGGGFIGTYGYYRLDNGVITSQKISSIYDLDGQLHQKIAPPGPFHDLTDSWALRDSNWFANFPDSAKKATDFYELEGNETPDAVIAITPQVFVDILKITGPVDFPKYAVALNADNFRRMIQLETSYSYDKGQNMPKQMLADFAPLLLQKLSASKGDAMQVLTSVLDNLSAKNIVLYDRNGAIEQRFAQYNWAGEIAPTDRDYAAVYNSNLGGKKTDLDILHSVELHSDVQPDGSIVDTLTYIRNHQQPNSGDNSFTNVDYARFLVPEGSVLLSASGFASRPMYAYDGTGYVNEPATSFTVDPDLYNAFSGQRLDSGAIVGNEAGKTEFSGWINTDPGQTSVVTLKYKLPFSYGGLVKYSLLVQKQPGAQPLHLKYVFSGGSSNIVWHTPDVLATSGGSAQFETAVNSDIFLGFVIRH